MIKILKFGEVKNEEIFARTIPTDSVEDAVSNIIATVRKDGDAALLAYTKQFDHAELTSIQVTEAEMEEAISLVEPRFLEVLEKAAANIRKYHEQQKRDGFHLEESNGVVMGQRVLPVDKAGLCCCRTSINS